MEEDHENIIAGDFVKYANGNIRYFNIRVNKFSILVDLIVLDMEEDHEVPLIWGCPFL